MLSRRATRVAKLVYLARQARGALVASYSRFKRGAAAAAAMDTGHRAETEKQQEGRTRLRQFAGRTWRWRWWWNDQRLIREHPVYAIVGVVTTAGTTTTTTTTAARCARRKNYSG